MMAAVGPTSSRVAASASGVGAKRRKAKCAEPKIRVGKQLVVRDDKSEDVAVENDEVVEKEKGIGPGETSEGERRAGARP